MCCAALRTKVPLQRFGTEAELSSAVVFLLSARQPASSTAR
jgi:NAD(P)-dependent dehydrogenase (short-subunit alcohol dehydrogenase family)